MPEIKPIRQRETSLAFVRRLRLAAARPTPLLAALRVHVVPLAHQRVEDKVGERRGFALLVPRLPVEVSASSK